MGLCQLPKCIESDRKYGLNVSELLACTTLKSIILSIMGDLHDERYRQIKIISNMQTGLHLVFTSMHAVADPGGPQEAMAPPKRWSNFFSHLVIQITD